MKKNEPDIFHYCQVQKNKKEYLEQLFRFFGNVLNLRRMPSDLLLVKFEMYLSDRDEKENIESLLSSATSIESFEVVEEDIIDEVFREFSNIKSVQDLPRLIEEERICQSNY